MGTKITELSALSSADGTEVLPVAYSGASRSVTVAKVKDYVIDAIEAITAAVAVASGNKLFALQSGALVPVDIDLVTQRAIDIMWGKADATPVGADKAPFKTAGGVEKTTTITNLAGAIRGIIEGPILDISDLADGSGALATSDYMLVTQGTTGKRITVQNLYDAIYTGLAAHVAGKTALGDNGDSADVLYIVRSGTAYKWSLTQLAAYVASQAVLSGTGSAGALAKWAGTNALTDGPTLADAASGFSTGNDTTIPTTGAVRKELNEVVNDATAIGAALAEGDLLLVYDLSATAQRKASMANVKTFVDTVGTYKELWIPANRMTPSTTNGASLATAEYGSLYNHPVMVFAGSSADDFAEFDIVMPEAWDLGTLKFKVYWTNGHADANAGEWVEFYLEAAARKNDGALNAALGTPQSVFDQHIADDDLHVTPASSALTVDGSPAAGDLVHFRLGRDYDEANGGTAMDVDARVLGVLIQYRENVATAAW